jgi:4'-phosphopantetheinyl transferase EntD
MSNHIDETLQLCLRTLAPTGILIDHRLIAVGDEHAILPEEAAAFEGSVVSVRRASGAARMVARALLARIGSAENVLLKSRTGAPIWPKGIVGSLAHDSHVAIAAVSTVDQVSALGIDIEPAETLPGDLLPLIATPHERDQIEFDPYRGRLLFTAKEAVYKALHPIDNVFLEHHDVEVDFVSRKATVRNAQIVELRFCVSTHLVALAFLPASSMARTA